jgi:transcriptional regulator with XRE-family HTH domain
MTVHQVIAHNVFQARKLRGWTQDEAARAITQTLGRPITAAGVSAIEKTFTSRRQRVIDAAELAGFARAFGLPIAWFFLPPHGRETDPVEGLYDHAATMAVDVFGDEDAWQWYLARIVDLIAAPRSILHDELLGSGGYPGSDDWAEIDHKREQLLAVALEKFATAHTDLIHTLANTVAELQALTPSAYAEAHASVNAGDSFAYLNDRVKVERVEIVGGLRPEPPSEVSPRYRPRKKRAG